MFLTLLLDEQKLPAIVSLKNEYIGDLDTDSKRLNCLDVEE